MKKKLDTLVILSPGFAANEADTTCLPPMQLFVKALKEICPGLNIIVIAFQYPFFADEYGWHGVEVVSMGGSGKKRLFKVLNWIEVWILLKKINRDYHVMGLLSFWLGECALVGSYFARTKRLPHYSWILGQDAKRGNKYFSRIKPKAESLIALSDFIAREVRNNYGLIPAQVIPVGIDTSLYGEAPLKRDIDVLGVGSLIPLKQYHLFVEAVSSLKQFYPEIKAVICGKGPELASLQSLSHELHLDDNLVFAGELPHTEVLALMQRSKIFLHTSNYEGYGAVIAEALYAGAHAVTFVKPMDKEYRHHHVVKGADEMHEKLLKLLKNTKRGHDPVLTYTVQQIAKNLISLFAV